MYYIIPVYAGIKTLILLTFKQGYKEVSNYLFPNPPMRTGLGNKERAMYFPFISPPCKEVVSKDNFPEQKL